MKDHIQDPHTVDTLQPGPEEASGLWPDPERRCNPAVARFVRDEGAPWRLVRYVDGSRRAPRDPDWTHLRLLGDHVFVVDGRSGPVFGPYPDTEAAYRATGRIRLETSAGVLLEWCGELITLQPDAPARWGVIEEEWSREVPEVVLSAEVDGGYPGGGSIVTASRWGELYWVWGEGLPPQLPEDHHPTLEAAWAAYMGGLWISEGAEVRSKELTPAQIRERFTLYSSTAIDEGVVTVNGEVVLLRTDLPEPDADARAREEG